MEKKLLCYGGILGPIVFLLNDVIGSIVTKGYNPIVNAVSELSQAGAENAVFSSVLFLIAAIMLIIFGFGITLHFKFKQSKLLYLGGIDVIFLGVFSALSGTVFPMDPFGEEATFAGKMHIILTGLNIILVISAILMIGIGLYKVKKWKSFGSYSMITVVIMAIFGVLTSVLVTSNIELLGLFERITIYAYQSWMFVLAFILISKLPDKSEVTQKYL